MAVTVAALNETHFLLAGEEHPRGWTVVAYGTQDALMKKVGYRDKRVSIRSTVGGSVRADQAALIEALTAIVSVPEGSGGGGDVDPGAVGLAVNDALKGSPQPIEGQVALPSDVVSAIGSAVNAAIRGGGALPVPAGPRPQFPPGTAVDFPISVTLADATEREIVLFGTSVPRSVATTPGAGNTVRIRVRANSGGDPIQPPEFAAITDTSPYDSRLASLDAPIYSILVTRTAGAGAAKAVIS